MLWQWQLLCTFQNYQGERSNLNFTKSLRTEESFHKHHYQIHPEWKKQEQLAETEEKGKGLCCATVFRETLKGLTWRIDHHLSYWMVFLCQQQVSCWFGGEELRRCREIGEAIERMERQQQAAVPGTRKLGRGGEGRNERGGEKRHRNSLSPNQADERWQPQSLGARITILSLCLSSSHRHTHTHTPRCWSLCRGLGCQAMFTHTLQKHCHLCSSVFHSCKG